jgi:uncharacterized membrane protein YidH (DUF202 family)
MSKRKKYFLLSLGIIIFIIGFSLTSFMVWAFLNQIAQGQIPTSAHSLADFMIVGLALVAIGMIVLLLTRFRDSS